MRRRGERHQVATIRHQRRPQACTDREQAERQGRAPKDGQGLTHQQWQIDPATD